MAPIEEMYWEYGYWKDRLSIYYKKFETNEEILVNPSKDLTPDLWKRIMKHFSLEAYQVWKIMLIVIIIIGIWYELKKYIISSMCVSFYLIFIRYSLFSQLLKLKL